MFNGTWATQTVEKTHLRHNLCKYDNVIPPMATIVLLNSTPASKNQWSILNYIQQIQMEGFLHTMCIHRFRKYM